jgi:hypothetical protein
MKTKILVTTIFLIFGLATGNAKIQEKDKKSVKDEKKLELQKQVEGIIFSKQFVFVATRALPKWGNSIFLTQNSNYLKFDPISIDSYMPFFGDVYSPDYNVDPGVKFEGKPEEFKIKKLDMNKGYDIRAKVSIPRDTYDIFMHVSLDGSANLTISSYRRSTISYMGTIAVPEKPAQPTQKEKGSTT